MKEKFLPKLVIASLLVGGVNFFPAVVNFNAENLQIISVAYAAVENVTASGEAIFNFGEDDAQIVNTVKNVARMRAIQAAKEKAGVFVKSQTKTVNGVLNDDDISVYTSNNIEILDVQYKKVPVQAQDIKGNDTGKIAFMYEATVTAKIDTSGLSEYRRNNEFIKENNSSQENISKISNDYDNLRNSSENIEQIKSKFNQIDDKILEQQKIDEANKIASQGWQLWDKKDYQNAILKFNEAIKLRPNHYWFYWQRGVSYAGLENYKQAIEDYTQAINLNPNASAAFFSRGTVYANLKNYQQAIADYTQAINLREKELNSSKSVYSGDILMLRVVYDFRATAYKNVENFDMAILDYTRKIELLQKEEEILKKEVLQTSDTEIKKWKEESIKDKNSDIAHEYYQRGDCYEKLKNYDQAISDYTQAIKLDPKEAFYYLQRGDIYEKLKNYEQAIKDFTQAIKLDPKDPDAYQYRGDCYEALGQYEKAGQDFAKAKRLGW